MDNVYDLVWRAAWGDLAALSIIWLCILPFAAVWAALSKMRANNKKERQKEQTNGRAAGSCWPPPGGEQARGSIPLSSTDLFHDEEKGK